tara:strand:+ start:1780 stop:2685 length:906 start_codon:yes stop_codon:yes gene_type:complete
MHRRPFIKKLSFGAFLPFLSSAQLISSSTKNDNFSLNYAPHFGMFENSAGSDLIDQIYFMAEMGFTAFEDNSMKSRNLSTQNKISKALESKNMSMGVFVANKIYWDKPNLASGDSSFREEFLKDISDSVEVAKRVNAKWMTVVPGLLDHRKNLSYQTANVIETLKRASEILEPHGLVMVLEPLNFRDHPGLFLSRSPQAYQICKSVDSPSCKILFDIYHQQIQEGNLIPNIESCWDEIGYFQIGDNPGRKEPLTGEINYSNVFKFIKDKNYTGILGMEHGNSIPGIEGEKALIEAYRAVDL